MNTSDQKTQDLLEQLLIWTRVSSFSNVEAMLKKALPTERERCVYQAMDPDPDKRMSSREIAMEFEIGTRTISALVKRCLAVGLMKRDGTIPVRLFDLGDFDMLPEPKKSTEKEATSG